MGRSRWHSWVHRGIVAAFSVADAVRPESLVVVSALQKMGIEVTMLSGDNNHAALVIGGQVGLDEDHIRGQLLPEDKLRIVATMKDGTINSGFGSSCRNRPRTMFCGDGVNDAPALASKLLLIHSLYVYTSRYLHLILTY